jgi:hypothetical protein
LFRYYDPVVGNYYRRDPALSFHGEEATIPYLLPLLLNSPQELNGYAYSLSNPLRYSDYSGLKCCNPDQCKENNAFLSCNEKAGMNFFKCQGKISSRQYACQAMCLPTCIPTAAGGPVGYTSCIAACSTACAIVHVPERLFCIHKMAKELEKCKERYNYDEECECN